MTIAFVRDPKHAQFSRTTWTLTNSDGVGAPVKNPMAADKCVQAGGTFNSGTVTIQGSNQDPPVDWATLHDPTGTDITFTTVGLEAVTESPLYLRPILTGTAGAAAVTVDLISKGH